MKFNGISDLQQSLIGRRQNANLRTQLTTLTQEIGSGKRADVNAALSGNVAPLASVTRSITMLDSFSVSANRVDLKLSYASTSLAKIQSNVSGLGADLLGGAAAGSIAIQPILSGAANGFRDSILALQVQVGNQYVFSGENSDTPPLLDADQILDALRAETAGVVDSETFFDTVDRWFTEAGNGFETFAYQGGPSSAAGTAISSTTKVKDTLPASDPAIRGALRDLAIITLADEGSFSGNASEFVALTQRVGASLLSSDDALTRVRADLGGSQQIVADAITQNQSERFAMSEAQNKLTSVDLFEAAGRLEELQTQLESLYLITARTSRLNLTEYLR